MFFAKELQSSESIVSFQAQGLFRAVLPFHTSSQDCSARRACSF